MGPQEQFIIGDWGAEGLDISWGNNNPWSPGPRAAFWCLSEVLISTQLILIIEDNNDDNDDDDGDDDGGDDDVTSWWRWRWWPMLMTIVLTV